MSCCYLSRLCHEPDISDQAYSHQHHFCIDCVNYGGSLNWPYPCYTCFNQTDCPEEERKCNWEESIEGEPDND